MQNIININTMNVKQYANGDDDVYMYMKSHYKSYTEDESEINTAEKSKTDTEVDELCDIIRDIKSTFD